jgi:hypothetical protein
MVVFVDLEDESEPPEGHGTAQHWSQLESHGGGAFGNLTSMMRLSLLDGGDDGRINPNRNSKATAALACYPYVPLRLLIRDWIVWS